MSICSFKTFRSCLNIQRKLTKSCDWYQSVKKMSNSKDLFQVNSEDDMLNHLFEESAALNVYDKTILNLAAGAPGPDLLKPLPDLMKQAVQHRMELDAKNNNYLFQYGPTAGLWGMRNVLAEFLTKKYGNEVKRESLVLTCGATHGLHLLISSMLAPNGVIFVEEYTYMIALQLFKEFPNFRVVEVPLSSDGVDVEKFLSIASAIKNEGNWKTSDHKPFWAIFYSIPNFHNPTSTLLPPEKCKALVNAARALDLLVACDDVYNLLYYGEDKYPPARLFSYDNVNDVDYKGGNIVSNGSFSKILAPGIRVGWMETPTRVALKFKQSGIMQSGGSVNNVMFGIIQSFIELGFMEKHLDWYVSIYTDRMKTFCETLNKHMPDGCSFEPALGGYFIWLKTPINTSSFIAWCLQHGGPGAVPSGRFFLSSSSGSYTKSNAKVSETHPSKDVDRLHAIRLTIGFHDTDTLKTAAEDLCNKLKIYMNEISQ